MNLRLLILLLLTISPLTSVCQIEAGTVPAGTPLALMTDQHSSMHIGQPIRARLLYPIYVDNRLVLAKDTVVLGRVVGRHPDHSRRVHALLGGDFTPFRIPEVQFDQLLLADGTKLPLTAGVATDGTALYRAVAPPPAKGGIVRRQLNSGLDVARSDLAAFIAPGKADRLLQFVYSQIPYHPQRIEKGTSWTVEASSPLKIPAQPETVAVALAPVPKPHFWEVRAPVAAPSNNATAWIVEANLADSLSSETSAKGQAIRAVVAQPIYNPDHTIAVPQGAVLVGSISRVQPARRFGRTGVLSFNFNQLTLPNAATQAVETRLTGADSAEDIALNSEGQAKSKPQDKISIPLILALMAARPLDQDGGHQHHTLEKNGLGGAAGLGLVGTVVGLAGGSPYAAAGIGYWGAARAFYSRWIGRGQKISFPRDTHIVVETTPRHSAPMKPDTKPAP